MKGRVNVILRMVLLVINVVHKRILSNTDIVQYKRIKHDSQPEFFFYRKGTAPLANVFFPFLPEPPNDGSHDDTALQLRRISRKNGFTKW